jgi:uncharacterized membrane protein YphA (DoxX/SURF4 family)
MKKNILIEIISALFILLFIYTATSKLMDYVSFREVLKTSPLIGNWASTIAWLLPILEISIGLLLLLPKTRLLGLWSSFIVMIGFTAYLVYMIYFTPNLPCSCGGVLKQMTWKEHLILNLAFIFLALIGLIINKRNTIKSTNTEYKILA